MTARPVPAAGVWVAPAGAGIGESTWRQAGVLTLPPTVAFAEPVGNDEFADALADALTRPLSAADLAAPTGALVFTIPTPDRAVLALLLGCALDEYELRRDELDRWDSEGGAIA